MEDTSNLLKIVPEQLKLPDGSFKGFGGTVRSIIIYPAPINKLVANGMDFKIRIFNLITGEHQKTLEIHNGYAYHLLKWDTSCFLSCAYDRYIISVSIFPPHDIIQKTFVSVPNEPPLQMMKINEEEFLVLYKEGNFAIHSFTQDLAEIKKLQRLPIYFNFYKKLVPSKIHENCVYINSDDGRRQHNQILLFDYKRDRIVVRFKKTKMYIMDMVVLENKSNHRTNFRELLLAGGEEGFLFLYDSKSSECLQKFGRLELSKKIQSLHLLNNELLLWGTKSGSVGIYQLEIKSGKSIIEHKTIAKSKRLSDGWAGGIRSYEDEDKKLRFFSFHSSGGIVPFRVEGIETVLKDFLKKGMAAQDLEERIQFIRNEHDRFLLGDFGDGETAFIKMKLRNEVFEECVFRIFVWGE